MSSSLVWELIRNHNSYLVKRNGLRLSSEPFNLLQTHSPKYSGLANFKGVDVQSAKRGAVAKVRTADYDASLASAAKTKTALRKGFKRSALTVSGIVKTVRPTLKRAALARLSKVHQIKTTSEKTLKKRIARQTRNYRK